MPEFGRDLWKLYGQTPLLKPGHFELVSQDHIQMAFEYLQRGSLHNLLGQPVPVLQYSYSKKVFIYI